MCAQFLIKTKLADLKKQFGISSDFGSDWEENIDERVVPRRKGHVVVSGKSGREVKSMTYSLVPSWSKEPVVKFATYNARIETLAEKPTWKVPLRTRRLLVPLTHFIEAVYTEAYAGNMIQFYEKNHALLAAAGIYDEWVDKQSGQILESFAIITDEPPPFVLSMGHDRCPIFLRESAWDEWLEPKEKDAKVLLNLLKSASVIPELAVAIDRPMAKGWEKRIPK